MRCYICDAQLSDEEVRFNRNHKDYDPCNVCKEVIKDTVNEAHDPDVIEDLGDVFADDDGYGGEEDNTEFDPT